ncbi:hypothetical protein ACFW04_005311 [Cataglyphis niger]
MHWILIFLVSNIVIFFFKFAYRVSNNKTLK